MALGAPIDLNYSKLNYTAMKHFNLLKTLLLLCALIVGSLSGWADETVKTESWTFNGKDAWTTGVKTYCGIYGNKSSDFTLKNASVSNFSSVDFSKVYSPSVVITVNGLTNSGTNSYTVCLVDKDGKDVGSPVTKTDGLGKGSNGSSAKESSVTLIPVSGATGYRITCPAKAALKGTSYRLTYTEIAEDVVATPMFSPIAGAVTVGTSITISCPTDGATIHYTTDGTEPTSASTIYSNAIVVNEAQTIKAIAIKDGMTNSNVATAEYTIKANAPTFSLAEGEYDVTKSVELSCTTDGATIYYTINGTTPTAGSIEYTGPISISSTTTVKAVAIKSGLSNSDVVSATYTLKVATPIFSLAEGEYDATQSVELLCATDGATIYYTTDEKTPTTSSLEYTGAIPVSSIMTIKAIAVKEGLSNSSVASAVYRVIIPATLPFSFDGGKSDIASTTGLTQDGIGADYKSKPYLKFDDTDDNLVLKFNTCPSVLSFDIMGNSFSGGTFTVQYSADGTKYEDMANYTSLAAKQSESFNKIPATARYIKWIYTKKDNGNVGLGNITLKGTESVSITAAGFATYASDKALDYSSVTGLKAYKATVSGTTITFEKVSTVPAGEGVLLQGDEGTYDVLHAVGVTPWAANDNAFVRGTGAAVATGDGPYNYILNKVNGVVGFYKANGQTVAKNRAYLQSTTAAARISLNFDEETTGISEVAKSDVNNKVFDLQGRHIAQPTKGLYIMNGRKVLVK